MERVAIPGGRDVRGVLDGDPEASALVVACPPHPRQGGDRSDARLRAISDALPPTVACLRFDYGPWDEARGEVADAENALAWGRERFARVGLVGYSFGAAIALLAAAEVDPRPAAVAAVAPPASVGRDRDAVAAMSDLACPLQVVVGEDDERVDWVPAVDAARQRGDAVESLPTGHLFTGRESETADLVAAFLREHLGEDI